MQLFTSPQTIRTPGGLSGLFLTPRAWKGIRPSSRWTPLLEVAADHFTSRRIFATCCFGKSPSGPKDFPGWQILQGTSFSSSRSRSRWTGPQVVADQINFAASLRPAFLARGYLAQDIAGWQLSEKILNLVESQDIRSWRLSIGENHSCWYIIMSRKMMNRLMQKKKRSLTYSNLH